MPETDKKPVTILYGSCQSVDYDEPWFDDTDEQTFSSVAGRHAGRWLTSL